VGAGPSALAIGARAMVAAVRRRLGQLRTAVRTGKGRGSR
jgi:hypothetical protein